MTTDANDANSEPSPTRLNGSARRSRFLSAYHVLHVIGCLRQRPLALSLQIPEEVLRSVRLLWTKNDLRHFAVFKHVPGRLLVPKCRSLSAKPQMENFRPPRRSATVPTHLMVQDRTADDQSESTHNNSTDGVLFLHPSAKIVKFAPEAPPGASHPALSADFDYPVDTIETLSWRSPTERTVAVGRLILERVHGLTLFLKCGTVVQPILKNSQCWCVDRVSTFVLRIRALTYYRIELPNDTDEHQSLITQFTNVLPKILRYEITPCPFRRGFSVEIPIEARTPKKKKAWRPKERRESAPTVSTSSLDWAAAGLGLGLRPRSAGGSDGGATDVSSISRGSSEQASISGSDASGADGSYVSKEDLVEEETPEDPVPVVPRRRMTESESVTNILARFQPIPESDSEDEKEEGSELSTSVESFHSFEPPRGDSPSTSATPPLSTCDVSPQHASHEHESHHSRDISDVTVTPETVATAVGESPKQISETTWPAAQTEDQGAAEESGSEGQLSVPATAEQPKLQSDSSDSDDANSKPRDLSPAPGASLLRSRSTKRELSPLPPSPILTTTPPPPRSKGEIAGSLIQKTFTFVVIPPLQLLLLLIFIAARIAGATAPRPAPSEPVRRITDGEDDFGVPTTPRRVSSRAYRRRDDSDER